MLNFDDEIIRNLVYSIYHKRNYLLNVQNVHLKINNMFDMLNLKKDLNQKFINLFFVIVGEKIINLTAKNYPKEFPRIRGLAEYYKFNDLYVVFCTGEPYVILCKYKKY